MQTLLNESRLTLSQLARSQGVNVATIWRWCTKGVRGVRLESLVIGGRRVTTEEAFERFIAATNPEASATATPTARHEAKKAVIAAKARLEKAGI